MRKTQLNKTQKTAVVGGTVLALAVGGVAFAAWTSTGSGDGTVTAGSAKNLVVSDGQSSSTLYPTVSGATVKFVVKNENPYSVKLSSFTVNSHSADKAGCTNAVDGITTSAVSPTDVIPTGQTATITVPVQMSAASDDLCQGAKFTFNGTAVGGSSN